LQTTITETSDWLTVRDAAVRLRVGRRTLDNQIRAGRLKAARVNGRDLRIHRSWLDCRQTYRTAPARIDSSRERAAQPHSRQRKPPMPSLAEIVRRARVDRYGMSQAEFAAAIGISASTLATVEYGGRAGPQTLKKLAAFLKRPELDPTVVAALDRRPEDDRRA
jgi:excisionase family DNA binding protein